MQKLLQMDIVMGMDMVMVEEDIVMDMDMDMVMVEEEGIVMEGIMEAGVEEGEVEGEVEADVEEEVVVVDYDGRSNVYD